MLKALEECSLSSGESSFCSRMHTVTYSPCGGSSCGSERRHNCHHKSPAPFLPARKEAGFTLLLLRAVLQIPRKWRHTTEWRGWSLVLWWGHHFPKPRAKMTAAICPAYKMYWGSVGVETVGVVSSQPMTGTAWDAFHERELTSDTAQSTRTQMWNSPENYNRPKHSGQLKQVDEIIPKGILLYS